MLAGAAVGFGFMAKVLPVAISPVGLFVLKGNRRRATYVGSAIVAVALVLLPFLMAAPAYVLAHFESVQNIV